MIMKMLNDIIDLINRNLKLILKVLYYVISIIAIYNVKYGVTKWAIGLTLIFLICLFVAYAHNYVIEEKKKKFTPKERFTIKLANGDIYIKKEKLHQAIIFLSIIEDEMRQ